MGAAALEMRTVVPPLPPSYVARTALTDRIDDAGARLVLVCAPAGSGKSTMVAGWASQRSRPGCVWLTLDERDADIATLWSSLSEVLLGPAARGMLSRSPRADGWVATITTLVVNELAARREPLDLVLDDCHLAGEAIGSLQSLIELLPPHNRIVMISRNEPPLRLSRLRVAGYLHEIGPDALRFTADDTAAMAAALGADLPPATLAELTDRTHGWLAGVELSLVQIGRAPDRAGIERTLAAAGAPLAEFVHTQLLAPLPHDVRLLLADLSILDQFTAADCAAVTGVENPVGVLDAAGVLRLFLTRTGTDSFRLQRLFRDTLRIELDRERSVADIAALHRRAADRFATRGETARAVRHLRAAGDHTEAVTLVRDALPGAYYAGHPAAVRLLLAEIDVREAAADPTGGSQCTLAVGLCLIGMTAMSREWLDRLDAATSEPAPMIAVTAALTRCASDVLEGDTADAARHWMRATDLASDGPSNSILHMMETLLVLKIHLWNGDFAAAQVVHRTGAWRRHPTPVAILHCNGAYAEVLAVEGRLSEAGPLAQSTLRALEQPGQGPQPDHHDTLRALASVHYEQGRLADAAEAFELARTLTESSRPACAAQAEIGLCRVHLADGRIAAAAEGAQRARALLGDGSRSPLLDLIATIEVRVAMAEGHLDAARVRAGSIQDRRRRLLALARVDIAAERTGDARATLGGIGEPTTTRGRIDLLVISARLEQLDGDDNTAAAFLMQALRLAHPEGMVRPFLEDGPELRPFLIDLSRGLPIGDFVDALRDAVDRSLRRTAPRAHAEADDGEPPALGAREMHVLELLVRRLTLADIAALYISRNTLKTHLQSIYRKLGVHSREEATDVALARGLVQLEEPSM